MVLVPDMLTPKFVPLNVRLLMFTLTSTVIVLEALTFNNTSSVEVGAVPPDQFAPVLQLPEPLSTHVF